MDQQSIRHSAESEGGFDKFMTMVSESLHYGIWNSSQCGCGSPELFSPERGAGLLMVQGETGQELVETVEILLVVDHGSACPDTGLVAAGGTEADGGTCSGPHHAEN